MAGGKGQRLKTDIEKPIFPIKDKFLIEYVIDNVKNSSLIDKFIVATSSNTPKTKEYLINDLKLKNFSDSQNFYLDDDETSFYLDTPALGYVEDLSFILDKLEIHSKEDILFFINADLPLVNDDLIDFIISHYLDGEKPALSTYVPVEIFEEYGINYSYEYNGNVPSGINILRSENVVQEEELLIISRYELAFNVNTIETAISISKFL